MLPADTKLGADESHGGDDAKNGTQLLDTLQVYLKHNKKIKKSSSDLFFTHYNTVIYRIERVCEILGIDPEKGDDMLQLHLAVKLHEMRPVVIWK